MAEEFYCGDNSEHSAPHNADYYINRAKAYYDKEDYDSAIADYTEAIRLAPEMADAYFERGKTLKAIEEYIAEKRLRDDLLEMEKTFSGTSSDFRKIMDDLWQRYDNRDFSRSLADFTQAIKLNPHNNEFYLERGRLFSTSWKGKDYERAIADFTEAIRIKPNNAAAYDARGTLYRKQDFGRAIADFTEAIRLDPNETSYYIHRADRYFVKKDYDNAIADYTEAIRLYPDGTYYYSFRADTYLAKKDYDSAIADCIKAIRLDPDDEALCCNILDKISRLKKRAVKKAARLKKRAIMPKPVK